MTLDEMRQSTKKYLSPTDVGPLLGCKPYTINLTIKKYGLGAYPWEKFLSGNRVRIPRLSFIAWAEATNLE